MPRQTEPMVMQGTSQVEAYHRESLWGGAMDSVHIMHLCKIADLVKDGDNVVDLEYVTRDTSGNDIGAVR